MIVDQTPKGDIVITMSEIEAGFLRCVLRRYNRGKGSLNPITGWGSDNYIGMLLNDLNRRNLTAHEVLYGLNSGLEEE